ncbi:MAG: CvpA family protein [Halioglobus sp.]|nr:CvpA family protein [Halioglobus sp.]
MVNWQLFNAVDWLIVLVFLSSMLVSLIRGFTREAISLAGWVAAFVVANVFAGELASLLGGWISSITGRYVVSFAILFVVTMILARLLARLGKQVVRATGLSPLDRLLGTVFGFARAAILVLVVAWVARQLVPPQNLTWLYQSQLMPHVDMLLNWVQMVFTDMGQDLGPGLQP